ncbi:methyltransferase [Paenibacillus solani]|uniref:methyltransferase n=1 Tax=Paenibacillus solani TaxID=1705565 RepID=UPI003D29D6AF
MFKKRKIIYYFLCTVILLTTACGKEQAREIEKNPVDQIPIVYENQDYHFTLELPGNWRNAYIISEKDESIEFLNKANNEAGAGGALFTIRVFLEQQWQEEGEDLLNNIHIAEVGKSDGKVYTFSTPTDVQFNSGDEQLKEGYSEMFKDVEDIKDSFRLTK